MPESRKYGSFDEWRKAEGGAMQQPTCQICGKPLKDARYKTCYDCSQKQRQSSPSGPALPGDYLQGGYFEEGHLRDDLIVTQPQQLAHAFVKIGLTKGQMRRFYSHVRQIERRLQGNDLFPAVRPALLELQPLVADAVGRAKSSGSGDYELFKQFIDRNVECAQQDKKHFLEGFLPHFQYVVAYFTYLDPKKG